MSEIRTKVRKAFYWLKHDLLVFDNIILIAAIVCCLAWTWGSISAMSRNWALAQTYLELEQKKALLELEVDTLELENEYYRSAEYEELAARKYQGKKLPGEVMIYLPENSQAAKNKHKVVAEQNAEGGLEMSNFQQWLVFLFGV